MMTHVSSELAYQIQKILNYSSLLSHN